MCVMWCTLNQELLHLGQSVANVTVLHLDFIWVGQLVDDVLPKEV